MPMLHNKNTNNQDSMSPPKLNGPIVMFPEKRKLDDTQENDFKILIMNICSRNSITI